MTVGPHRSRLGWAGTLFTSGVLLLGACTAETKTSAEDFCGDLRRTPSLASVLTGFADQDADQLDRALDDAEEAFTALERSAPDEIRSDVEALVALVQAVIDGVRDNPNDPEAAAASITKAVKKHSSAMTSGLAVSNYALTQCDLVLNTPVPEDSATTGGSSPDPGESTGGSTEGGL